MNNKPTPAPNREIVHGLTPGGGAYQITYYFDRGYKPTVKEQAAHAIIHEYDENGRSLRRTYQDFVPEEPYEPLPPPTKPQTPPQGAQQQYRPQQQNNQRPNGQRPSFFNRDARPNGDNRSNGDNRPNGEGRSNSDGRPNGNGQRPQSAGGRPDGNGQRPQNGGGRPDGRNTDNRQDNRQNAQSGTRQGTPGQRPDRPQGDRKPNQFGKPQNGQKPQQGQRPQGAQGQGQAQPQANPNNVHAASANPAPNASHTPDKQVGGKPRGFHDRRSRHFGPRRDRPQGAKPPENKGE